MNNEMKVSVLENMVDKINELLSINPCTNDGRCTVDLCINANAVLIKVLDNTSVIQINDLSEYGIMINIMKEIDKLYNKSTD